MPGIITRRIESKGLDARVILPFAASIAFMIAAGCSLIFGV